MERALGLILMGSLAGCLSGSDDFGGSDGSADGDADGDSDGDADVRTGYPEAPYWVPGEPPSGVLADMEFPGNGSDDTISFGEIYADMGNEELLVYHLCVS